MIDESTFSREVQRAFGDLLRAFGYDLVRSDGYCVRYEKTPAFVEVDYDARRSNEISIWLGDERDTEPPLALTDALRATACDTQEIKNIDLMQTADPATLNRLLKHASELLRECGADFLVADHDALAAAHGLRSLRAEEYHELCKTERFWRRRTLHGPDKDYERVHDLLNPIRDSLDSVHRRRLKFAEKKL